MRRYLCGVKKELCSGSNNETPQGGMKLHPSPEQAFRCKVHSLLAEGYKRIGPREFCLNDTSPILILNKKTHFGGVLRGGKKGDKGGATNRTVFLKRLRG